MASGYDFKVRIGTEGEKQFIADLKKMTAQAKALEAQTQAVTASFTKNTSAQERAQRTGAALERQVASQQAIVDQMALVLQRTTQATGEDSEATAVWQRNLALAEKELFNLKGQLQETTDELARLEKGTDDAGDGLDDLEDNAGAAADKTDDLGDAMDGAGQAGIRFGDVLRANILGDAIMKGLDILVDKAKDFASGMVEGAAAVRAENSQFSQAFGDLEGRADAAVKSIAADTGVLETRLRSSAAGIYSFARASGADSAEALSLMEDGLRAAADNAAYYDRSLEDATETLQSFLKGNFANDAALGVSATETTRNAAAMKRFGKEYKKLTEIQKQQTLLQMVLDAQELSGAMGQASREADGWENVQGNLNEAIRQMQAAAGQPLLNQFAPRVQKMTERLREMQNRVDWDKIANGVDSVFGWFDRNGEATVKTIAAAGAAFLTWKAATNLGGAVEMVKGLGGAVSGLGAALLAHPYALAAAGIAAVIGIVAAGTAALNAETAAEKAAREEYENFAKTAEDTRKRLEEHTQNTWSGASQDMSQWDYIHDLVVEYYGLMDAQGKVAEKDQARVDFINTQLNDALGLELERVGDVVKGYEDIALAVNGALSAKKLEILMGAAESEYAEAIKTRTEVEEGYYAAHNKRIEAQEELEEKEAEYYRLKGKNLQGSTGMALAAAEREYKAAQDKVQKMTQAEQDYEAAYRLNTQNINRYETAMALTLQGKTVEAIRYMEKKADSYTATGKAASDSADVQIDALEREADKAKFYYDEYRKNLEAGMEDYTKEGLAAARQTMLDAQAELRLAGWKAGEAMMAGTKQGVEDNTPTVTSTIKRSMGNLITASREKLQIHSPSRAFGEMGRLSVVGYERDFLAEMRHMQAAVTAAFAELPPLAAPELDMPETRNQSITIPNINIYAQEGQDAEAIADAVERRILRGLRTEAAF